MTAGFTVDRKAEIVDPIVLAAPDIDDTDVAAVTRVLRSGWITTGEETALLESELAAYLGADHVVATSSCTAALEISIAFLALPPGARVGVPTWTFVSSALAAVHAGLQPVLLDVDADTLNLSPRALEAALAESGLDAVVGVHFGGNPLSEEIHQMCSAAAIPLVEDAAHALGASDHRGMLRGSGTAGACFSFYATKNLTSAEGGALATDDPELGDFASVYRLHGLSRDAWSRYRPGSVGGYDVEVPGIKGNMPDLLAALARSQLARFEAMQARRREIVRLYRANLEAVGELGFVPSELVEGSADHLFVVILPQDAPRSEVRAAFQAAGIGTSVHFQPLHELSWFRQNRVPVGPGGTPHADEVRERALSLPLHPGLTDEDVSRVCQVLLDSLGR